MPTNLPADYYKVEEEFRTATSPERKIALLEEMLSIIPKHKGTDRLRGDLRRKLARLKEGAESRKGTGKQVSLYQIDREGAGQAMVVGMPNTGKSALVAGLTNATPEVADYPFTTWVPTPGMMPIEDVQVQLIDTPPLSQEFIDPDMLSLIRRSDLVLIVIDVQAYPLEQLDETVEILAENRILPPHRAHTYTGQRRVDVIPMLVVVGKTDDEAWDAEFEVLRELLGDEWPLIPLSIVTGRYVDRFKQAIFDALGIIRVYSKPPGKPPDFNRPFVLKQGADVEELAGKVHKDFLEQLKAARVWGSGAFEGQMVGRDHVLHDKDVVELRM
ncbi:MAG: 50S ribosome-binding GTPase [Anaerolineae bacterium]|nr:50S ribosome-binding GTPase [Anaerolineae bacterium]